MTQGLQLSMLTTGADIANKADSTGADISAGNGQAFGDVLEQLTLTAKSGPDRVEAGQIPAGISLLSGLSQAVRAAASDTINMGDSADADAVATETGDTAALAASLLGQIALKEKPIKATHNVTPDLSKPMLGDIVADNGKPQPDWKLTLTDAAITPDVAQGEADTSDTPETAVNLNATMLQGKTAQTAKGTEEVPAAEVMTDSGPTDAADANNILDTTDVKNMLDTAGANTMHNTADSAKTGDVLRGQPADKTTSASKVLATAVEKPKLDGGKLPVENGKPESALMSQLITDKVEPQIAEASQPLAEIEPEKASQPAEDKSNTTATVVTNSAVPSAKATSAHEPLKTKNKAVVGLNSIQPQVVELKTTEKIASQASDVVSETSPRLDTLPPASQLMVDADTQHDSDQPLTPPAAAATPTVALGAEVSPNSQVAGRQTVEVDNVADTKLAVKSAGDKAEAGSNDKAGLQLGQRQQGSAEQGQSQQGQSQQGQSQQGQPQYSVSQQLTENQSVVPEPLAAQSSSKTTAEPSRPEGLFSQSLHAAEQRQQHSNVEKTLSKSPAEQLKQSLNLQQQDAASNLRERVSLMVRQNIQVAEIRLDPAGLGQMQIKIDMQQDQASVQFIVQQPQAKELLEQQLPRLREMLQQQGIQLTEGQVQQQSQQQERQMAQRDNGRGSTAGSGANSLEGMDDNAAAVQVNISHSERLVDYYA
ncbi:flagellar hook-length control protein FliK [Rheinheimera maricola]|uniref:Flagellar hook-length control protein FliK n=1 Tax=Rheinheimera maricola TaxID=2793282 RepID=A0ABS7X3U7_9GAMM|nr:flagellar hook-length control protein FliK [Rheinheimera maricola]MBZ9610234.1 flagellar hook-length control protein FliK [Rheinheimera maricola]